jgi:hypothetical protein
MVTQQAPFRPRLAMYTAYNLIDDLEEHELALQVVLSALNMLSQVPISTQGLEAFFNLKALELELRCLMGEQPDMLDLLIEEINSYGAYGRVRSRRLAKVAVRLADKVSNREQARLLFARCRYRLSEPMPGDDATADIASLDEAIRILSPRSSP